MGISGKAILKRLEADRSKDKGRVTLYLSKGLYKEFKKKCGKVPASLVLEELLKEFVATSG